MPKYKLSYLNARGRGEIIQLVLTDAGQGFEDHRFEFEEWPEIKKGTPFGQVLVLEEDERRRRMNESLAIARYLAKKYSIGGKDAYEQYLIDRVLGAVGDLYMEARQLLYVEKDEIKTGTIADLAVHDILTTFLQINDKLLDCYPELQINRTATEELPNLDTYLAERPKCEL